MCGFGGHGTNVNNLSLINPHTYGGVPACAQGYEKETPLGQINPHTYGEIAPTKADATQGKHSVEPVAACLLSAM